MRDSTEVATLSQQELAVSIATRNDLSQERHEKHKAIIDILKAVVVTNIALVGTFRYLPQDITALFPAIGVVIALCSMYMVRSHRRELRRIEWRGSDIEEYFKDNAITVPVPLFTRPDSVDLPLFTIPVLVHMVLIGFWFVMYLFA